MLTPKLMLVGKYCQAMTPTRTSGLQDIATVLVLHSLTKAVNPQTAPVFRLKGSFHFRLLLLRKTNIKHGFKEKETARVRKSSAFRPNQRDRTAPQIGVIIPQKFLASITRTDSSCKQPEMFP